ncbi:transposase [Bradyrhizobium sp. 200]|nr:transposase [Bradyrhizobium sp. 200]
MIQASQAKGAKQLYCLSELEWKRIEPLLPRGRRWAHRVNDRRVISGILHMLRSGARWRDCPPDYGPYTTIYNRFNRWSRQGVWSNILYALTGSLARRAHHARVTAKRPIGEAADLANVSNLRDRMRKVVLEPCSAYRSPRSRSCKSTEAVSRQVS